MKRLLRTILFVLNLLLAVLLLLSTLAGVLPPSHWVAISLLSYAYPVLLVANGVMVIVWLCLARWEFLLSVAAIVLRFSFVPLFFQTGGHTEVDPADNTVRLMSYNVHGLGGLDSDTLMTADSGGLMLLELIDQEQPDVMCLQEFVLPGRGALLDSLKVRGYRYHYGVHGENPRSQCILFSRCKMKGHDLDRKSKFYVDLMKNDHRLRVCCVHLDSYQLREEDYESLERLTHAKPDEGTHRVLAKLVETTRQHEREWKEELFPLVQKTKAPLVIAGDFNDTPASYIYQQATDTLLDAYVEQGRGLGITYHGPYPAFRIDYILHSPDIQVLSYKRIKSDLSDHYPIIATLQLP